MRVLFYFSLFLLLFSGCGKAPMYDEVPTLQFVRFSLDTVQQQTQVVTLVVGFTDGDGDIGSENNPNNFIIIDTRRGDTSFYSIPELPRVGASDGISGEIEIDMAPICCIDPNFPIACNPIPGYTDAVRYICKVQDNAGNWSNEAETEPLYIRCYEP